MKQLETWMMDWIDFNLYVFAANNRASEQERQVVYEMRNHIFGSSKKPNSCGRCWRNTKAEVYKQYTKQKSS